SSGSRDLLPGRSFGPVRCFSALSAVSGRHLDDDGEGCHQQGQNLWKRRPERFHPEGEHGRKSSGREELQTLNSRTHFHIFAQASRPAGRFPTGRSHRRSCAIRPPANPRSLAYEPPSCVLTFENVADAFVPTAWMAVRQTTMIRASITAYSTAVGPSSE